VRSQLAISRTLPTASTGIFEHLWLRLLSAAEHKLFPRASIFLLRVVLCLCEKVLNREHANTLRQALGITHSGRKRSKSSRTKQNAKLAMPCSIILCSTQSQVKD